MLKLMRKSGRLIWEHLRTIDHPAIFPEMRVGKTLPVFRYVKHDFSRVLLVAPAGAYPSWKKWFTGIDFIPFYLLDRKKKLSAIEQVKDPSWTGWLLFNNESMLWYADVAFMDWDCVIIDESRSLANPRTKISKFFVRYFRDVKKRIIITGEPAPENLLEYIQQLNFLNPALLGMTYWHFRSKYCRIFGNDLWVTPTGKKKINEAIAKCAVRLTRADVRTQIIQEKRYIIHYLDLPEKWVPIYKKAEKELVLQLPGQDEISTIYSIVAFHWLRKICSGFMSESDIDPTKISALISELKKVNRAVVWASYRFELLYIYRYLSEKTNLKPGLLHGQVSKKKREQIICDFQGGKFDVLVIQPTCSKYGNDFSMCDNEYYYSSPLGLETRNQSEDRLISLSKNRTIQVHDFVFKNTIDRDIINSIRLKDTREKAQWRIYNAIKKRTSQHV